MSFHQQLPVAPPDGAAVEQVAPGAAQAWCNFVLWVPTTLPAGCQLLSGTLNKEAPPGAPRAPLDDRLPRDGNSLASYRSEVVGDGRRLRIKQFCYDWAFPALDHPSLWLSKTRAVPIDDRSVLWFGTDFRSHPAAATRLARTTIEMSILNGTFSEAEQLALVRGLQPVDSAAAAEIAQLPFAELSYWARRPDAAQVVVPIGLWTFRRREHTGDWSSGEAAVKRAAEWNHAPLLAGLELDSAAAIDLRTGGVEMELVYAGGEDRGIEVRVIMQQPGGGELTVPAAPERHPAEHTKVHIGETLVQLAWIDPRYGPFHAVFADPGRRQETTVLSTTGVGLDRAWFTAVLTELLAGGIPSRSGR